MQRASTWLGILVFSFAVSDAQSQKLSSFDFLRLEPSAQASALGGTLLGGSLPQSSAALFNPAMLNTNADKNLSVSWLNHLSDLQFGTITYARNFDSIGMAAAGVRFFHWGRMDQADVNGERTGTLSASNVALSAGISRLWKSRFRYGANLHLAYTSITGYNAVAVAMDIGMIYHDPKKGLTTSVGASNVGITLSSLGQTRDVVPLDLRVIVSKRLKYIPVLLGLSLYNLQHLHEIGSVNDAARHTIFSFEFQAIPVFHIRMGYNHRKRALKSDRRIDLAGTSIGFGLHIRRFRLDYSFNSWSFAGLHQFTVTTRLKRKDQ